MVADIVRQSGDFLLGFLDDEAVGARAGIPVLGKTGDYVRYPQAFFIIGIGSARVREELSLRMEGARWYTAIHPAAVISPLDTWIGEGTAVMANAVVNPGARVGKHAILNTSCVVEHDDQIGDYCHISVGARLGGSVQVGKDSWIGIGAAVKNGVSICDGCTVGAGAVVVRDIDEPGIYIGVPARKAHP